MSRRDSNATGRDDAGESFLQRWSRLKSTTREDEHPDGQQGDPTPRSGLAQSQPEQSTPAVPTKTVLPDIESLGEDSDYSAFLAADVDVSLRRAALRKLFRSPKFNVLDGLDDYCGDFTQFAPLAGIVTSDMRHHIERAAAELESACDRPKPRLRSDDEPRPGLPDAAADTAAAQAQVNDTAAALGAPNGDTAGPASEESEENADRRPA